MSPLRGLGKVDGDAAHRSRNLEKGQFCAGNGLDGAPQAP